MWYFPVAHSCRAGLLQGPAASDGRGSRAVQHPRDWAVVPGPDGRGRRLFPRPVTSHAMCCPGAQRLPSKAGRCPHSAA